jgi:hypothetical protein
MSTADAIALCRAARASRPLPPSEPCPYEKEDARYRWRLKRQRQQQSGWQKVRTGASERHKLSQLVARTGWVD